MQRGQCAGKQSLEHEIEIIRRSGCQPRPSRPRQSPGEDGEKGPTDLIGHSMTPMMDALMSPHEPKTGADGTMSWSVDVVNHATGDDFVMFVKELVMPDGQRRLSRFGLPANTHGYSTACAKS